VAHWVQTMRKRDVVVHWVQTMTKKGAAVHLVQTMTKKDAEVHSVQTRTTIEVSIGRIQTKKKRDVSTDHYQTRTKTDYCIGRDHLAKNTHPSKTLCLQSKSQLYRLLTVCRTLLPFAYLSHLYSIFKYNDVTFSTGQYIANRR
jgi:hypothetical protein